MQSFSAEWIVIFGYCGLSLGVALYYDRRMRGKTGEFSISNSNGSEWPDGVWMECAYLKRDGVGL